MKKILFLALFLAAVSASYAQDDQPVHLNFFIKRLPGGTYALHCHALIDPPYHIYAQDNTGDIALPTTLHIHPSSFFELQGKMAETGTLESQKDATTGITIKYYSQEVDFVQLIKLKHNVKTRLKGYIDFMACTDEHCLPEAKQLFNLSIGQ
jgi:hypothetical protein